MLSNAGVALLGALALTVPHHHHRCHWHLRVTGGQQPNSTVVLHLTNSCVNNGGPQVVKRIF